VAYILIEGLCKVYLKNNPMGEGVDHGESFDQRPESGSTPFQVFKFLNDEQAVYFNLGNLAPNTWIGEEILIG